MGCPDEHRMRRLGSRYRGGRTLGNFILAHRLRAWSPSKGTTVSLDCVTSVDDAVHLAKSSEDVRRRAHAPQGN